MNPDIVTLTLNPAIDETVFLDELYPGAVNRCNRIHRQAGGKGINVSAMLGGYGIPTTATGFLGNENPRLFEELFQQRNIRDQFIRVEGETRTGIKIVDRIRRETTDLNFPGLQPSAGDIKLLEGRLHELAAPERWFVIGGSLPPGVPLERFEHWLALLRQSGARIAADTHGEALKAAIRHGVDLIKPNLRELEEILGHNLSDDEARFAAARRIQTESVPHVILSRGARGALFLSPDGACDASPPPVEVISTVGAGDSLLAGYLAGWVTGMSPASRAQLATVFSWSALENLDRMPPAADQVSERMRRIEVRDLRD